MYRRPAMMLCGWKAWMAGWGGRFETAALGHERLALLAAGGTDFPVAPLLMGILLGLFVGMLAGFILTHFVSFTAYLLGRHYSGYRLVVYGAVAGAIACGYWAVRLSSR